MHQLVTRTGIIFTRILLYGFPVGLIMLLSLVVMQLQSRPELSLWHQVKLDAEFTVEQDTTNFEDYLETEERVFEQLDQLVYQQLPGGTRQRINRYSRDSLSNPDRWAHNWNRSFELPKEDPRAGVLLLHGMSDSPYSLHSIGQALNDKGARVLGLRYPGHGTVPSGLTGLRWQDMARAVELAVAHLRDKLGEQPIYIVGYSAGGALAVNYALQALSNAQYPRVDGLVLISPAIGVTPLAAFAVWQGRLGYLLGLDKLNWTDIKPEYDPYKYNSFAVNAGDQVYRLTVEISKLIDQHTAAGDLVNLPPILAFQSSVDATVSTAALVDRLFSRLPQNGNKLVLFDINRRVEMEPLLLSDPTSQFSLLFKQEYLPFSLTLLTNSDLENDSAILLQRSTSDPAIRKASTGIKWPNNIYSLSHVALPFSPDDPLYGPRKSADHNLIYLGNIATRGERGVLQVSAGDMLRLRWNPFYPLMDTQIKDFLKLD